MILTRRDSELAAAEVPSFDLLDGVDVVAWNRRWRTQVELEKAWRRRAISPRVVYRTDDNLALQRLVAAGYGHACLDRLGAAGAVEPSLTWLEPKEILVPRTIALCYPRHRDASAEALTLMEAVRTQFGDVMTDARLRSRVSPAVRSAIETVTLDPPRAGEVLVRIIAAGVCHSDVRLADGELGRGRWPIVLGHEGAGVVEAVGPEVTGLAAGDHVVLSLVPACGRCAACRSGRRTLCEPAGANAVAGTLMDGTSRLRGADGETLQHGLTVACFAQYAVVAAAAAIPIASDVPLWQAALLGCGVVTGFGAVAHAARVRVGERVCVVGCGGVGLQVIAAAHLAGAAQIVAVDRRPEKLEHALARGATHAVDGSRDDPATEVLGLTGGGVDHAFEVVGAPATIRTAWDVLRPGGTAVVVGLAPAGARCRYRRSSSCRRSRSSAAITARPIPPRHSPASSNWSAAAGSSSPTSSRT